MLPVLEDLQREAEELKPPQQMQTGGLASSGQDLQVEAPVPSVLSTLNAHRKMHGSTSIYIYHVFVRIHVYTHMYTCMYMYIYIYICK